MSIRDEIEKWQEDKEHIHSQLNNLRQRVADIEEELNYEPQINFPPLEENLKSFGLIGDQINTFWEYVDGYEAICDSSTNWAIPLAWFEMSDSELSQVLVKKAKDEEESFTKHRLWCIAKELGHYGYSLVEKEDT